MSEFESERIHKEKPYKKAEAVAEPEVKEVKPAAAQTISLDLETLIKVIDTAVSRSAEASSKMLAEALTESRKPYVDPRDVENEKNMRDQMKKVKQRMDEEIKSSQRNCGHLQGSNALSNFTSPFGLTSIVQHVLDTGELIGICTNCLRIFTPQDEDYGFWMRKKSGNQMSQSGQRFSTRVNRA